MSRRRPSGTFSSGSPWAAVGVLALAAVAVLGAVYVIVNPPGSAGRSDSGHVSRHQPAGKPHRHTRSVSVLSDSHAFRAGSWFRLSVGAGRVPHATPGVLASYPLSDTSTIRQGLPRLDGSDVVIVQAGTQNLLAAQTPEQTAREVEALVADAGKHVVTVIWATIPPSNTTPTQVVRANALISSWARSHDVPVLDVSSPVAAPDGRYRPGMTLDGIHASPRGSRLQADAATRRLSTLLATDTPRPHPTS